MEEKKQQLLHKLSEAVLNMEDEEVVAAAEEYLRENYSPEEGISHGLVRGMQEACRLYDEEEYFIADILLCSDTMYEGMKVFEPHIRTLPNTQEKIRVIIGVVAGDTHDIGKNLVRIMMETAGFEMIDLGKDVASDKFIETVKEEGAKLLCLSALMTTTMEEMAVVIRKLQESGLRQKVKVMVGGGPLSSRYAEKIGADAYSKDAVDAVRVAKRILKMEDEDAENNC